MDIKIEHGGNSPIAIVQLKQNEAVVAESTTLVGMTPGIQVETKIRSGQIKPYLQGVGEEDAYFLNTYHARERPGEVLLAPRLLGEIWMKDLAEGDDRLLLTLEAFLGADPKVEIETAWRGGNTFQMSAGVQMLRCSGIGTLLLSGFGTIHAKQLKSDESFIVDRAHLIGFTEKVQMRVRQLGGINSTVTQTEDFVAELQGPGSIYLQTRSQQIFLDWIRRNIAGGQPPS